MKFSAYKMDNVRWRSETLHREIAEPSSVGNWLPTLEGGHILYLGWHDEGDESSSLCLELNPDEVEFLYRQLGERISKLPAVT